MARLLFKFSTTDRHRWFDFHSLRHLHDFVRQPTILDYFVRDSALLGLDACVGRNNAGIDAHNVAQAQNASVRSVQPNTLDFRRHLEKVAPHSASFVVRCRLGIARGRFWPKAAGHWHVSSLRQNGRATLAG